MEGRFSASEKSMWAIVPSSNRSQTMANQESEETLRAGTERDYVQTNVGAHGDFVDGLPISFWRGGREFPFTIEERANGVWVAGTETVRSERNHHIYHVE